MTMPFFSAIPTNLPITPEGVGAPLVSAGPYYVRAWTKSRTATVVRNPYWNNAREPWKSLGSAGERRPDAVHGRQLARRHTAAARREPDRPRSRPAGGARRAGAAVRPQPGTLVRPQATGFWYLALNNEQPLFRGNPKLRQAVNWAIDRPQLVRQFGFLGAAAHDQILRPACPDTGTGTSTRSRASTRRRLARARSLAQGNTRNGKATLYTGTPRRAPDRPGRAVQPEADRDRRRDPTYDRVVQNKKSATRGEPFDITIEGWGSDYADPYNFLNVLLDGRRIQATNNDNLSYFNDARYNQRMEQVSRLSGDARYNGYAKLDVDITKDAAPLAPFISQNARILVGEEIGCYSFQPVLGSTNLVAVCKK